VTLKQRYQIWRFKRAVARVRSGFAVFDCDLSGMTDEEISMALLTASRSMGMAGVSAREAANALVLYGLAIRRGEMTT